MPTFKRPANIFSFRTPTPSEIKLAIKNAKRNSAPGPDKISYDILKKIDPTGRILNYLYDVIIRNNNTPRQWKTYSTILISKPGKNSEDYKNVDNWRPIALLNTSYKILTACLCNQLSSTNNPLVDSRLRLVQLRTTALTESD